MRVFCDSWGGCQRAEAEFFLRTLRTTVLVLGSFGMYPTPVEAAPLANLTRPEYLIDTWETEHGLPENSATAIVQTPDGYLWFGTFNGLVRFNGAEFKVFNPANTPQLPSGEIANLHLDAASRLWVSTDSGLVLR